MQFYKLEALGNDFILFYAPKPESLDLEKMLSRAAFLCERRRGIGADGILLLSSGEKTDFTLKIINSDGSLAEMCGNGLRCAALVIYKFKLSKKKQFKIKTEAGIIPVEILEENNAQVEVKLRLGKAELELWGEKVKIEDKEFKLFGVSMGNPHCVVFAALSKEDVVFYGSRLESHPLFPRKTNVEFVEVIDRGNLRVKVWERGAGLTLACGSGACGAAAVAEKAGWVDFPLFVELPGGKLLIEKKAGFLYLTGPARLVFKGEIDLGKSVLSNKTFFQYPELSLKARGTRRN